MPTFEPTWESLHQYQFPAWFQDAKFGIFIHWGAYCVPAVFDEWYPRRMYQQGTAMREYHCETYGEDFGYKDFLPLFTAEKFDPAEWAELFRRSGARYVVPVAEHHDGFPMYASRLTRWNAAQMGPQRDVLAELGEAVRAAGLHFGLSSHRAEHWWFMNGGRDFPSDVQQPEFADFYGPAMPSPDQGSEAWGDNDWTPRPDAAFLEDWLARCMELVDRFHPQVFYFDWWIHQLAFKPYLLKFAAYYYNQVPDGVINYKLDAFEPGTAVHDIERGFQSAIQPEPWQTCTSVSRNSWGYISHHVYKNSAEIIHHLVDVASKNGCLLLNVGPRPDGAIPEPEQQLLRQVGDWLQVNGAAIYDTRPWRVFGEGPTELTNAQFSDNDVQFSEQDIRFTTRGSLLYAIALGDPGEKLRVHSLSSAAAEKVRAVKLLGYEPPLDWLQDEMGLDIHVPSGWPGSHAWVFEILL